MRWNLERDAFGRENVDFGEMSDQVKSLLPFGYTGEQMDVETGLTYLRSRYYDSVSGRFMSRDSFGGYKKSSQSQNRYVFGGNNPASRTDPSGQAPPDMNLSRENACSIADCDNPNPNGTYPLRNYSGYYVPGEENAYVFEGYGDWLEPSGGPPAQAFGRNVIVGRGLVPCGSFLYHHEFAHLLQNRDETLTGPCRAQGGNCYTINPGTTPGKVYLDWDATIRGIWGSDYKQEANHPFEVAADGYAACRAFGGTSCRYNPFTYPELLQELMMKP